MGAGVIPFVVQDGKVSFLFQTTFSGRKAGYLVDFGGGSDSNEDHLSTAIREFIEETETLYFSADLNLARRTDASVREQIPLVETLFHKTLADHPDWWCRRMPGNPLKPKRWTTFFIEFPYRDIQALNREWAADRDGRFKKRRQLHWVEAQALLDIYEHRPQRLWTRVRQLEDAPATIRAIHHCRSN